MVNAPVLSTALIALSFTIASASEIEITGKGVTLDFSSRITSGKAAYLVKRSNGRYSPYITIGRTRNGRFEDKSAAVNPYSFHYIVMSEKGDTVGVFSAEEEIFGPDVRIFGPTDNPRKIAEEIGNAHRRMFSAEMSPERYVFLFKPGDYRAAGPFNIGFYTHMAGLGKVPYDVLVDNINTPPHLKNDNGTCTFWRSVENFSIIGTPSYAMERMCNWAVSQAAPFRRMYSERTVRNQWKNGWVSGGFTADSYFNAPVGSDGQQQWFTRNSYLDSGRGKFAEGAYNFVFSGVELGPEADTVSYADADWDKGGNVTFIGKTPVVREKPFLYIGDDGRYKIFRPALRIDSSGVSYTRDNMGDGETMDLLDNFYVARPSDTARQLNAELAKGKNLLLTPGTYELDAPLHITHDNAMVMGLGWATLVAPEGAEAAMIVDDLDGVQVASILFDAHHSSETLLKIGDGKSTVSHADNPMVFSDIIMRIGGFLPKKVHVDRAMEINSNNVIGDHFWIWRADHGVPGSVGWDINTADNGLVVNGDDVTIYGLFNEHFQQYQTLWQGERGRVFFYQCETPYDAPRQELYISENGTRPGYAAYKVADSVDSHTAYGLGIYDVLHNNIMIENSMEVPDKENIEIRHIVNTSFIPGPEKGFNYVINGFRESTYPHPGHSVARVNRYPAK